MLYSVIAKLSLFCHVLASCLQTKMSMMILILPCATLEKQHDIQVIVIEDDDI